MRSQMLVEYPKPKLLVASMPVLACFCKHATSLWPSCAASVGLYGHWVGRPCRHSDKPYHEQYTAHKAQSPASRVESTAVTFLWMRMRMRREFQAKVALFSGGQKGAHRGSWVLGVCGYRVPHGCRELGRASKGDGQS